MKQKKALSGVFVTQWASKFARFSTIFPYPSFKGKVCSQIKYQTSTIATQQSNRIAWLTVCNEFEPVDDDRADLCQLKTGK